MKSELGITIVQSNLHWESVSNNLKMFDEKISFIKKEETDVIVLPEMFTSGFTMKAEKCFETMNGQAMEWMKEKAEQTNAAICGSLIIKENEQFFNRLIWMQPDGKMFFYNKKHLFRLSDENQVYQGGQVKLVVDYLGWKIKLLVCYDLRFPVWCRQNYFAKNEKRESEFLGEFDAMIVVANWPSKRELAWKTLLQARSIENQCYVVGVNRVGDDGNKIAHSGNSSVIASLGDIIFRQADEEKIFTATLSKDELIAGRRTYQFWKDADDFELI